MTAQASHHLTDDLNRALQHHQHGELDAACRAYRKVLRRRPDNCDALRLLATVEMQRGHHDQAERHAREALRFAASEPGTHNTLGQVLAAQDRFGEAREVFEQALKLDGRLTGARASLGRCLLRTGQVQAGVDQMCLAAQDDPGDPALACEIAEVLMRCGNAEAAEQYFLLALEWAPGSPVSYLNLGAFYIDRNRPDLAVAYLGNAAELDPEMASVWMNLSRAQRMLGHLDAALESLSRVLSLQPGNPDALAFSASVLHQRGDYTQARRLYTDVLVAHPAHAMAAQGLAELHEWSGEYEAAVECLEPIIQSAVYPAEMVVTYARTLRRVNRHEQAIELLERFFRADESAAALSDPILQQVHFTLANLHDESGDYEQAWQHARTANSMSALGFDTGSHSAMVDQIVRAITDAGPNDSHQVQCDADPIFIVGMPRSGTSLVEQVLAAHPQVFALGETSFIGAALSEGFAAGDPLPCSGDDERIRTAFAALTKNVPADAARVTEKTPLNFLFLGLIQRAFPGARVIHCKRHPLDTMLSCFFTDFRAPGLSFASDLDALASYYRDYERMMEHWRGALAMPMHELSYEDLVSNPEPHIRALLEFAGLDWSARCLEHHLCRRTVHTASHAQVRQPIYTRAVGRWRNYAEHVAQLTALGA